MRAERDAEISDEGVIGHLSSLQTNSSLTDKQAEAMEQVERAFRQKVEAILEARAKKQELESVISGQEVELEAMQ